MLTRARDVGDGLEDIGDWMPPATPTNVHPAAAKMVAIVLGRVIGALRDGARSARDAGPELTYSDGWASASNLAGIVSAETIADLMSGAME
jgi:hypothetical protein